MLAVGFAVAEPAPDVVSAWKAASAFRFNEARDAFVRGTGDVVARKFGEGATLLNVQPRTGANIQRALTLFEEVAREAPPRSNLSGLARFYIARVKELYLTPQDLAGASADYRALLEERTGNPLIEQGASRLAAMAAFASEPVSERLKNLASLEPLAELLETSAGRREFHTSMAFALLDNGGDKSRAVDYFLEADRVGFTRKVTAVSAWLVAGRAASEVGRTADARYFYEKMLAKYPRDPRAFTVRTLLQALPTENG